MMHTHSTTDHKVQAAELWLTYLLYAPIVTAPLGALLSIAKTIQYRRLLKLGQAPDIHEMELLASHYEWLNRTALVAVVLGMMALGTAYYFVGFIFAALALLWWCYRIGRGVMALYGYKSPPVTA